MRIACLGECMVELAGNPLRRSFGGDTLNTALYLARLLAGTAHRVEYLSALGDDTLSEEMEQSWIEEGIDTREVLRLPGRRPGLYLVEVDALGERRFHYWREDSAARHCFSSGAALARWVDRSRIDMLYLSGISLALFPPPRREELLVALAAFKAEGGQISFDNNLRPALWSATHARPVHDQVLALTDTALLTLADECQLHGTLGAQAAADRALGLGCTEVVIKRGGEPCLVATAEQRIEVPARPVTRVVDSCAAGDAFAAGYLAARIQQQPLRLAAESGHRLAAAVIQHPGAIIPRSAMPI
ncbi:sugar kinase [Pseudomonas sp. zfem005]|uniref:sugar kinase n=1 Tax=Pseudomonas sp. zfem005 TaxID=3078200 RepID=UPI002929B940|nr:sugar kinase [Pseudomonas sp. zfem005]MDU9415377.1 sugar kinase [Pseudomonas sp. zfem005]